MRSSTVQTLAATLYFVFSVLAIDYSWKLLGTDEELFFFQVEGTNAQATLSNQ